MATQLPSKIGKYDLHGLIGRGGLGIVFDAHDPDTDRRVAIKMIGRACPEGSDDWIRFSAHADFLSGLHHPNLVNVYGAGLQGGFPYLVMEFVDGQSLDHLFEDARPFRLFEKINIMARVCDALAFAHRHGVAHDDIKPSNILLCADGSVKITDLGIIRAAGESVIGNAELNSALGYIAPEYAAGTADHRADLFSTGAVLYQFLTDRLPGEKRERDGITAEYPGDIALLLNRALATNPAERYQHAEDFASDLRRFLGQLTGTPAISEIEPQPPIQQEGQIAQAPLPVDREATMDPPNQSAIRLLGDVQRKIEQPEPDKPIINLWMRAEKALADERFEEALDHAEKALALDPQDLDLQQLAQTIRAEAARIEKLKAIIGAAEAAQADGNLDSARRSAEEAVRVAPNSAEAKALYKLMSLQALEVARHRQVENSLQAARQEISSRNFSGAIEILRRAEELDPNAPGVQSLIQLAVSGQQQERQRQQTETRHDAPAIQKPATLRDATEAMGRESYDDAIRILEELAEESDEDLEIKKVLDRARSERADTVQSVLRRVEEEPDLNQSKVILRSALLKLPAEKKFEEKLMQVDHYDQVVSKAISEARRLEEAGQYELALAKWEMVQVLHPRHPDLKSAPKRIRAFQERTREASKQTWIDQIERSLSMSEYSDAAGLVEVSLRDFPWDQELMELQDRTEAAIRQRSKAQRILEKAQKFLSRQKWEAAGETFARASQVASEDAVIRQQVVDGLLRASHAAMMINPKEGELILRELARVENADPESVRSVAPQDLKNAVIEPAPFSNPEQASHHPAAKPVPSAVAPPPEPSAVNETLIPSGVLIDNVRFTVIAPGSLAQGAGAEIQFWVNAGEHSDAELEPIRQTFRRQEAETRPPESGSFRGPCLSVRLKLGGGLTCLVNHKQFVWFGALGYSSFLITVPPEALEGDLVCVSSVRLNGCQVAKVSFLLKIGSRLLAAQDIPCQTVMHRKAFASFEAADRDEVLTRINELESVCKALKVYVDAPSLRSVTYWEPDLYARINAADVFYLFWSRNALASDWVAREWRWALRSKGLDFIDPVPLQSSEMAPPPDELAAKPFDDLLSGVTAEPIETRQS
jgi:serine/threonine protein kinase